MLSIHLRTQPYSSYEQHGSFVQVRTNEISLSNILTGKAIDTDILAPG